MVAHVLSIMLLKMVWAHLYQQEYRFLKTLADHSLVASITWGVPHHCCSWLNSE